MGRREERREVEQKCIYAPNLIWPLLGRSAKREAHDGHPLGLCVPAKSGHNLYLAVSMPALNTSTDPFPLST